MTVAALALAIALPAQAVEVETCLAAAADLSCLVPSAEIPADTRQVVAALRFADDEPRPATITAAFIAVDVGDAAPPNYRIIEAPVQLSPIGRGRVRYDQPGDLPVGRYKVAFTADGRPLAEAEFRVIPPLASPDLAGPADLLPLRVGQEWRYDLVQVPGPGATIRLPDVAPQPDGSLRAPASYRVAAQDGEDFRIELRRGERLVMTEWWRLGPDGLAVTRRQVHGDEPADVRFDPPQPLWPWPLDRREWTWEGPDGSAASRMFGPLPVATPDGSRPGFLVVTRAEGGVPALTVARAFVPGVGMVREDLVQAFGPITLLHQSVRLVAAEAPPALP